VRYIRKGQEPRTVTETRCARTTDLSSVPTARDAFGQLDKDAVRGQLVEEQGWLCAFCMRHVNERAVRDGEYTLKIAHRTPVAVDPRSALTWSNLLGSCDGGQRHPGAPRTCDLAQGSTPLTLDPTRPESMARLTYERRPAREGLFLTSADPALRSDVEDTLALNAGELPALREAAWKAFQLSCLRRGPRRQHGRWAWRDYFPGWLREHSPRGRLPQFVGTVERMLEG